MTDDEVRQYLHPRTNWLAVGGFVLAVLGAAAGLGKWVFTAPTKDDYQGLDVRTKAIEVDHAILKANVEGLRNDVTRQDVHLDSIDQKLDKLLERRR